MNHAFDFTLGDVLVFLNEKNLLRSPISLTDDRIKQEISSLRRQKKSIRMGICRAMDRNLFNNRTIQHLGSLTFEEFEKIALEINLTSSLNESEKSLIITDDLASGETKTIHKDKRQQKFLIQKRGTSPTRDSGFIETDGKRFCFSRDDEDRE